MRVLFDKNIAEFTSMKVGGICRAIYFPTAIDEIKEVYEKEINPIVFGKLSNVLISDKGLDRAVIILGRDFSKTTLDGEYITVESGLSMRALSEFAYDNGLSGFEFINGIPGSVGGGIWMNAGAYGPEIKDILVSVKVLKGGELIEIPREDIQFGTRYSSFQDSNDVIVEATFKGVPADKASIRNTMEDLKERRTSKQPLNLPSCGSVFKRPDGAFASMLIDSCGLKGMRIGGAQVSEKHAGFIVNVGGATCKDVVDLIDAVRKIVRDKTGYSLECEVRIIE